MDERWLRDNGWLPGTGGSWTRDEFSVWRALAYPHEGWSCGGRVHATPRAAVQEKVKCMRDALREQDERLAAFEDGLT